MSGATIGVVAVAGSPINVPANIMLGINGSLSDLLDCRGIINTPITFAGGGGILHLNGGIFVSGAGQVGNGFAGTSGTFINADTPASGISGGSLRAAQLAIGPNGAFNATGGSTIILTTFTNAGILSIGAGATFTANSPLIQSSTGTLKGNGAITADISLDGTLAPGNSPGILTINGSLSLAPTSLLNFELGNPNTASGDDRVDIFASPTLLSPGNLTLDGTLNITDLGNFGPGSYTLFNYKGTLTDNSLLLNPLPKGFAGSIVAGAGKVVLIVSPEPSSLTLFASAALLLAKRRRSPTILTR